MTFKDFFKQKTIRFLILVFAALLIISNAVVYGATTIQYQREQDRQLQAYTQMMSHLLTMEDQETAITYTTHYYHTQGIRIAIYDLDKTKIFATEESPETNDFTPIYDQDKQVIAYVIYDGQFSIFGRESTIALIIINGLSVIFFFMTIRLLYTYINKTYAWLEKDLNQIGRENKEFYFDDLGDVSKRLVHLIKSEKKLRDDQKAYIKVLAHDIKTPLTVLKAYLEGLQEERISLNDQSLKDMLEEVYHMENLMPQLLLNQREEAKDKQNLKSFIEESNERYLALFESKNLKTILDLEEVHVVMSHQDMKRMIENLMDNAFHYSSKNQTIHIFLNQEKLSICDQGKGMDQTTINKIKKGPYRSEMAKKVNKQGSGMGLQIVQDIVKNYGFNISFKSNEGKGQCVSIFLNHDRQNKGVKNEKNKT
jgi:signal transduction histidine kinase